MPKTCFSDGVSEEDMYEPPRVVLRGFWDSGEEVSWLALAASPRPPRPEQGQNPALISPQPLSLP